MNLEIRKKTKIIYKREQNLILNVIDKINFLNKLKTCEYNSYCDTRYLFNFQQIHQPFGI